MTALSQVSKRAHPTDERSLVARLNSMPREKSYVDLGIKTPRNVHGYYINGRGSNQRATVRDARGEAKAADWWSMSLKNVNRVRDRKSPKVVGRKRYRTATALIDSAQPTKTHLYRGMKADPNAYRRGGRVDMAESSWSADKRVVEMYANRTPDKAGAPVVMHLARGGRATNIAPLTRYRNAEWVTPRSGYKVSRTVTRDGVKHVYLVSKGIGPWIPVIGQVAPVVLMGGMAARAATQQAHQGRDVYGTAHRTASAKEREYRSVVDRASRDRRYKPVGNNVYARNRRLFPAAGRDVINQAVADNKGSRTTMYYRVGYPNQAYWGVTLPDPKRNRAAVNAHPGLRTNPLKRVANQFGTTHETAHAHELAGRRADYKALNAAAKQALAREPRVKSALKDYLSGSASRRNAALVEAYMEQAARWEGSADAKAAARHRIPAHAISAYPYQMGMNPLTSRGYTAGGGKTATMDESLAARKKLKRDLRTTGRKR